MFDLPKTLPRGLAVELTSVLGEQITPENFSTGKRGIGGNSPCLMSRLSTPQLFFPQSKTSYIDA
ncbi:MAG: hypothetical protein OXH92_14825 [Bryobacterales bacterium]|nr:hypothetical protein [Bryobacterales bacterium]MDE0435275.1 hypothetical protein [Bryobacterales bacterium]